MKEYSQRTVNNNVNIGKYLTERAKEGWEPLHIQFGAGGNILPSTWYIILVRDSKQKEITSYE